MATSNVTFLFSDETVNPDRFFQGYCFVGTDYINGPSGGDIYVSETGAGIPAGEDGCYVTMVRRGDAWLFGTDHHGYKKLFYYWTSECWIVSNSLYLVAEHLRGRGIAILPNYAELAAMPQRGMFFSQMTSFETVIRGVRIVPPGHTLYVGDRQPPVMAPVRTIDDQPQDYRSALGAFLNTWVARAETLLSDSSVTPSLDITGGVDSRAVLSIFLKAMKRLGGGVRPPALRCGSVAGDQTDLAVAQTICQAYDLPLNQPIKRPRSSYSGRESVEAWRDLCLGVYHAIYLPKASPHPAVVHLGGAGGGNHRVIYDRANRHQTVARFIDSQRKRISPEWLSYEFADNLTRAFHLMGREDPAARDYPEATIAHYRYFRNRFHAGRSSQYAVVLSPLGSRFLDAASSQLDEELKVGAQINYDIMASMEPALLEFAFDKESKRPSSTARENLEVVEVVGAASPGKVYIGEGATHSGGERHHRTALEELGDMFQASLASSFAREFWGEEFVADAVRLFGEATARGGFEHAAEAAPVSCILTASLFFE